MLGVAAGNPLPCLSQSPSGSNEAPVLGAALIATRMPTGPSGNATALSPLISNGIQYNGGPILDDAHGVNVYFIWYGDWSQQRIAQRVLVNFITHLGGSAYFNINTTYYSERFAADGQPIGKDRVLNAIHYRGSARDLYSQGTALTSDQVYLAVANAITSGELPLDAQGVYFLLTSPDVTESGFGTRHCGWHNSSVSSGLPFLAGVDIKYAFVGDAEQQFAYTCIWDYQTPLSGSLGADGMANIMAHELEESVTDPDGTSWINPPGTEIADLCAWKFGAASHSGSASDPYPPNMLLNGIPYLIQEDWLNAQGGYCALAWPRPAHDTLTNLDRPHVYERLE